MRSKNLPEVLKADIDFREKDCRGSYRNFKLDKKTEAGNRKPTNRTAFQKKNSFNYLLSFSTISIVMAVTTMFILLRSSAYSGTMLT